MVCVNCHGVSTQYLIVKTLAGESDSKELLYLGIPLCTSDMDLATDSTGLPSCDRTAPTLWALASHCITTGLVSLWYESCELCATEAFIAWNAFSWGIPHANWTFLLHTWHSDVVGVLSLKDLLWTWLGMRQTLEISQHLFCLWE